MALLISTQAESFTLNSGASIITDSDCTPNSANNAVLINNSPENIDYFFGIVPSGTTKIRFFVKKQTANISDSNFGVSFIGSVSPQYSALSQNLTTEGLHYLETTTLPTTENNQMNIGGDKLIIDRIEFHDDTVAVGTIIIPDQNLPTVFAGTYSDPISFAAPSVNNCTDTQSRILVSIGVDVVVTKNGITLMAVDDTFLATDSITYFIPNNIAATTAYRLLTYVAVGDCGNSNFGTITVDITTLQSQGGINISNQILPAINSGTSSISIVFAPPIVTNGCIFDDNRDGIRTLASITTGVTIKKNGTAMIINEMWRGSDIITCDVAGTVPTTLAMVLFTYNAHGSCGISNVASIISDVTLVSSTIGSGSAYYALPQTTASAPITATKKSTSWIWWVVGSLFLGVIFSIIKNGKNKKG